MFAHLLSAFTEARWLTPQRARAYCRILLALSLLLAGLWVALARNGIDRAGHPLGTDFIDFWAASRLALSGHAADAYVPERHGQVEAEAFAGHDLGGYTPFFYPPTFLLVCLPLALLPYLPSLVVWLAATFYAYWRGLRALLPQPRMALPILAFPAVLSNAGHGQNGFLTTALFAGAAHWLGARPVLGGLCLGGLCVKPHLALLVPVALLAGRQWRALLAAAAGAAGFGLLSLAVLGADAWRGFLRAAPQARQTLEQGLLDPAKLPSVFAAVRLLDGSLAAAYAVQAVAALAACAVLLALRRCWAAGRDAAGPVALLVAASLLANPYLLDYDLMLLAIPLAWSFREALRDGFLPWEKLVLAAGFVLPLVCRSLAQHAALPLGPVVIAAVLASVARRLRAAPA
jgi:hypothetical protein